MDGERNLLTTRELEILRLVALGQSNRDIAEELVIAPETVRWYTKQIYSKLGISGRIQAVNLARELGLLTSETIPASTPIPHHNLPVPITPLIGRIHEITEVKNLFQAVRLLTLTGVGGTGKTRLALRVASEMRVDFADGVSFVDLAPVSDPKRVINVIAAALGVIGNPNEAMLDTVKRALAGREMLLLIDNFEHVIEAAPHISDLLGAALRVKVLVTSREVLRIAGEQEYAVPSMSLPADDAISIKAVTESEAGSLFVQRAQMVQPRFAINAENVSAVAQICARLDGLPLAIELAAARCKLLTPQAMIARLSSPLTTLTSGSRGAPPRQQTLRATLDWSYNLLDESEKKIFALLAVFQGGCSLEAIEAVCQPDLPIDVFDELAALVDKSLIQQKATSGGEPRFVMLETIHEYARERLAERGEADMIRRRYAEYFVDLAERAEPELRLSEQFRWLRLLELERDNLRAVLEWSLDEEDTAFGVRLAGALFMFWVTFAFVVEGQHWTQHLTERLTETPKKFHAKFLICAGYMAWFHDIERAKLLYTKAIEVSRELGEQFHEAWALTYMSVTLAGGPAFSAAEAGLSLFKVLDHKPGIAQALNIIGEIARFSGDDERAKRAYQQCLAVVPQTGDTRLLYAVLYNLAYVAQHEGDHQSAITVLRRSLTFRRDLAVAEQTGDTNLLASTLHKFAFAEAYEGDQESALAILRRSLTFRRDVNEKSGIASNFQALSGSLAAIGQPERAARLLGAAETILERVGSMVEPQDQPELDRNIAAVIAQLDETAFAAAWAEGRKMTLEQAVAHALEEE